MVRYIVLIIIIITLFSLFALFEKPTVNQHSQKRNTEAVIEKAERLDGEKKNFKMIYNQDSMDFFIDAYGVGNP